jgi:rhodanese-related sulfurtransferase
MAFSNIPRWRAEELHSRITSGEKIFLVDVRSAEGRTDLAKEIPGARWIPLANLIQSKTQFPHDTTIVTYCT